MRNTKPDAISPLRLSLQKKGKRADHALTFVAQKHWAIRLHFDFWLELDGTMKIWTIPEAQSCDPRNKRMAVHVEDHPISYSYFERTIPAKQ